MRGLLLLLSAAVTAIVLGLKALLRLPGVPYNVSELFLDGGSAWRLTLFAVAVLWIGAGPALAARWLRSNRRPFLARPIAMIALAMVSRTLLKYSVTYESVDDILATNNLYARVTNEHIWGELWRRALLAVGPRAGFRVVRRAACPIHRAVFSARRLPDARVSHDLCRRPAPLRQVADRRARDHGDRVGVGQPDDCVHLARTATIL
jgi:hypothetical protein